MDGGMDFMRSLFLTSALCSIACFAANAARADVGGLLSEARFGVYEHDASVLGHQKETGADLGLEFLFQPVDLLFGARPIIGGLANTSGETNQVYVGATWTWDFLSNIVQEGDGLYVEGTLGGGWNDGEINVTDPYESQHRKSLGSHFLFREDVDLGYHITPVWSVALSYNHISDADLAVRNEGLNDIGLRIGMKF
jgi:lipid A 3-O-deacylase